MTDEIEARSMAMAELNAILGVVGSESLPDSVTLKQAMKLPAVFAAVNFLSNALAALPAHVYERGARGAIPVRVYDHPVDALLNQAATDDLTAFDARRALHASQFGPGRGFMWVERDRAGDPVNIWPLAYARTSARRLKTGALRYDYVREAGTRAIYRGPDVVDLTFSTDADTICTQSPVLACAGALRQGLNAAQYALTTFGRNGVPPYTLSGPLPTAESARRAADDVAKVTQSQAEKGRPVLPLPAGFKLEKLGADPDKMQLTEVQRFVVEQVARIYSLPPVFLQDLSKGNFANTEQQDLFLLKHTLAPRVRQVEQVLSLRLFGRGAPLFVKLDLDQIARGVLKDRIEAQARAIQSGQMTINEAREENGLPRKDGGDDLFIQSGTVPIDTLKSEITPPETGADGEHGGGDD